MNMERRSYSLIQSEFDNYISGESLSHNLPRCRFTYDSELCSYFCDDLYKTNDFVMRHGLTINKIEKLIFFINEKIKDSSVSPVIPQKYIFDVKVLKYLKLSIFLMAIFVSCLVLDIRLAWEGVLTYMGSCALAVGLIIQALIIITNVDFRLRKQEDTPMPGDVEELCSVVKSSLLVKQKSLAKYRLKVTLSNDARHLTLHAIF